MHTVTLIPGDGIGPEVTDAMVKVVEASGAKINWEKVQAGEAVIEKYNTAIPDYVIDSIKKNKVAIKGPITTPVGKGFKSVNVTLRQKLDLYVNLRPIKSFKGIKSRYEDVDLVIVRENTEDLYAGIEHKIGDYAAESIKIITKPACERICKFAFDYANKGATNIYNAQIKNKIKVANKTVAIFEISENNKGDFESFYDVSLNQYPFAINVNNNNETKYNFTSDVAQNIQFMDDSL